MPKGLVSAGKLVTAGHTIILDDPEAIVINKKSKQIVMGAHFDPSSSTWNVYPDGPDPYPIPNSDTHLSLDAKADITPGIFAHFANNVCCLNTKQEIVEYYHAAAG